LFQIEKEYALPNRQCTSFHAAGCHFTGPVALRLRLSSDLPIILFPLSLCKKLNFIIRLHHTVHKKNMTAFLLKNDKKAVSGAFSILFSASSLVANSQLLLRNKKNRPYNNFICSVFLFLQIFVQFYIAIICHALF